MTEKTASSAKKILTRAAGLDDLRNGLAAYVGTTGKAADVTWLVYIKAEELDELFDFADYLTVSVEAGAHLNDF